MFARIAAAVLLLALSAGPSVASPVPITTLYSTGVNGAGNPIPGSLDPHYTITGATSPVPGFSYIPSSARVVTTPNGTYPITPGVWALNSYNPAGYPTSWWIAPSFAADQNWAHSTWTYRTTFDLTGLDPTTASITGLVAADNAVEIRLNGQAEASFLAVGDRGYTTPSFDGQGFTLGGGFVAGLNVLEFIVRNGNLTNDQYAPTGLRVAMSGFAEKSGLGPQGSTQDTPEPTSLTAVGLGLAGLLAARRRK